jgi:tetratricopeptide (TPR) repeat protein
MVCWFALALTLCLAAVDSRESLQLAVLLVEQGKLVEAEREARRALADPAAVPVAYAVLGGVRLKQEQYAASIAFLEKALRLEPRLLGARLNLAQAFALSGKSAAAAASYRRVLELDANNAPARVALAASEAAQGRYRRSLDFAQPVLDEMKQTPDGLLVLATDLVALGQRERAAELATWPGFDTLPIEWPVKFALVLAKGGLAVPAAELLERVKQSRPPAYEIEFNLAGIRLIESDLDRALQSYDEALALRPDSIPALKQAALVAERRGELERSLSYWVRVKKLQPDDPETLYGFGKVCLKMDLLEDGEPALARAVLLKPEEPSFTYALASARIGKKQFASGEALLAKLLEKRPRDPHLQYALGAVLYLEGKLGEAAAHLRASVRLQPLQTASYYYLGLVARDQGDAPQAIRLFADVLSKHPDHALSYEALGILLFNERRYQEAKVNLEKAVELNPKSVKANYQLGLLLSRLGEKEAAAQKFDLAKSLRQEDEATSRLQLRLLDPEQVEQ